MVVEKNKFQISDLSENINHDKTKAVVRSA